MCLEKREVRCLISFFFWGNPAHIYIFRKREKKITRSLSCSITSPGYSEKPKKKEKKKKKSYDL